MGLFDFVKDAGEKMLEMVGLGDKEKKEAESAAKLEKLVGDKDLGVEALSIRVREEVVTVHGTVPSQEVREKVVLLLGNTQGVAKVDDRMRLAAPEPEPEPEPVAEFYTVTRGDTLSKIARQHYGDAMKYTVIFEANRPMLEHPDRIYPGQVLRIPRLDG